MPREESEVPLRNLLFAFLSQNLADPEATGGRLPTVFPIRPSFGGGTCVAEGALEYTVPNGTRLRHKNDILVTAPNGKHIAIELKHLSAVSDQFKCRAYDMLNLKQTHGERLRSILVYIRMPGIGISLDKAKAICYPFDQFLGFTLSLEEGTPPEDFTDALKQIFTTITETIIRELETNKRSPQVSVQTA